MPILQYIKKQATSITNTHKSLCAKMASIAAFIVISSLALSCAQADTTPTPTPNLSATAPTLPLIPSAPDINAKGYVLMDADSGKIIASKNMDKSMPPASLTKLMTLYIISQAIKDNQIKLDDTVHISKSAWQRGGSRMFVEAGSDVSVKDLISGIIVASGNDSCVAMAEYIAGSESGFAELMNQTASRLGMTQSHFVDSTGLPSDQHYSTPHDLAILTQALIRNFPEDYSWYKQKWINYNNIKQPNRNRLLWRDPSVDGLKTGHTKAAGFCLISSAKRNGMRLISIVMGAPSDSARSDDSVAILNWGFRFYETHILYSANTPITNARVYLGKQKTVPFGVTQELAITIPKGTYKHTNTAINISKKLRAPIQQGNSYGTIDITLNNENIISKPLVALDSDAKAGVFSRLTDYIAMSWNHMFS